MKKYKYLGREIHPCQWESEAGYRWYLPTTANGLEIDERQCPRFQTLSQAKEYIERNA